MRLLTNEVVDTDADEFGIFSATASSSIHFPCRIHRVDVKYAESVLTDWDEQHSGPNVSKSSVRIPGGHHQRRWKVLSS